MRLEQILLQRFVHTQERTSHMTVMWANSAAELWFTHHVITELKDQSSTFWCFLGVRVCPCGCMCVCECVCKCASPCMLTFCVQEGLYAQWMRLQLSSTLYFSCCVCVIHFWNVKKVISELALVGCAHSLLRIQENKDFFLTESVLKCDRIGSRAVNNVEVQLFSAAPAWFTAPAWLNWPYTIYLCSRKCWRAWVGL